MLGIISILLIVFSTSFGGLRLTYKNNKNEPVDVTIEIDEEVIVLVGNGNKKHPKTATVLRFEGNKVIVRMPDNTEMPFNKEFVRSNKK